VRKGLREEGQEKEIENSSMFSPWGGLGGSSYGETLSSDTAVAISDLLICVHTHTHTHGKSSRRLKKDAD